MLWWPVVWNGPSSDTTWRGTGSDGKRGGSSRWRFCPHDPLLRRPALVVKADDSPIRPGQRGADEALPKKELPEVMLDLGDDSREFGSRASLMLTRLVGDVRGQRCGRMSGARNSIQTGMGPPLAVHAECLTLRPCLPGWAHATCKHPNTCQRRAEEQERGRLRPNKPTQHPQANDHGHQEPFHSRFPFRVARAPNDKTETAVPHA